MIGVSRRTKFAGIALVLFFCVACHASRPIRERPVASGVMNHPAFAQLVTTQGNFKTLYIAGQTSVDANGNCVSPGDFRGQYVQVMENLSKVLAAGGASFSDVTFIRRFVTSIDAFLAMSGDRDNPIPDYFEGQPPASTLIEVNRLADRCFLVEVDLIAAVPAN